MVDLYHLYLHLVTWSHSVKKAKGKPKTNRLLSMEEIEKLIIKLIIALMSMVTFLFSLSIGLQAYKAHLGIVKECQCNR